MFNPDPISRFAIETACEAGLLARQVQVELVLPALVSPALTKDDRSPVTVADFAAQALVGQRLRSSYPDDLLVAEEDSSVLRANQQVLQQVTRFVGKVTARRTDQQPTPEEVCAWIDHNRVDTARRFWTLDPIDGTKGFLRGDQYALALALVEDGQVQVGVLACPMLTADMFRARGSVPARSGAGCLAFAARSQGAWVTSLSQPGDFQRLSISTAHDPAQARILRSVESGHTNIDQIDHLAEAMGVQTPPVRMDSQAKYVLLAAGQAELYLRLLSPKKPDYREKIWDQAAGALILAEAGGQISDLDGRALDFTTGRSLDHNRGILASNRLLHSAALASLRAIGA